MSSTEFCNEFYDFFASVPNLSFSRVKMLRFFRFKVARLQILIFGDFSL